MKEPEEMKNAADGSVESRDLFCEPTEEQVLKAIYESGIHQYIPGVLRTKWKDGIDVQSPSNYLLHFVKILTQNEKVRHGGPDVTE